MKNNIILSIAFVLMTSIGAYTLNSYTPYLSIAGIFLIVSLVSVGRLKCYPLWVWAISASLILGTTMLGHYIVGSDIHGEYYVADKGFELDYKNVNNTSVVLGFLCPFLKFFGISVLWQFKLLFPLVYSFVPVILYYAFKYQIGEIKSFFATFFFMSVPMFFIEITQIEKSMLAEFFFAFMVLFMTTKLLSGWSKINTVTFCAIMTILCHYTIGILAIMYLTGYFVLPVVFRYIKIKAISPVSFEYKKAIIPILVSLCVFFLWFGAIGHGFMLTWFKDVFVNAMESTSAPFEKRIDPLYTVTNSSTSPDSWLTGGPDQRYSFYAANKYWQFFSTGKSMAYSTSDDGKIWAEEIDIRKSSSYDIGSDLCIDFDGTYVHYMWGGSWDNGEDIFYRMGLPKGDGTISWIADENVAVEIEKGYKVNDPTIIVDSNGYPWIAYGLRGNDEEYAWAAKSSTKNGIFTNDNGFPCQFLKERFDCEALPGLWCIPVALTNGKVYIMAHTDGLYTEDAQKYPMGRLWNGESWEDEETIVEEELIVSCSMSAVSYKDEVHLTYGVWNPEPMKISTFYVNRIDGKWSNPVLVQGSDIDSIKQAALSIDDNGSLYCFWVNDPYEDHVYFKKCIDGVWDMEATDWVPSFNLEARPSVSKKAYNGYILFATSTTTGEKPYSLKTKFLDTRNEGPLTPAQTISDNPRADEMKDEGLSYMSNQEPLVKTAVGLDFFESSIQGKLFRMIQFSTQIFMVLGFLFLLWKWREYNFSNEFISGVVCSFILLILVVFMPSFSSLINASRYYQVSLFFLSPMLVVGIDQICGLRKN